MRILCKGFTTDHTAVLDDGREGSPVGEGRDPPSCHRNDQPLVPRGSRSVLLPERPPGPGPRHPNGFGRKGTGDEESITGLEPAAQRRHVPLAPISPVSAATTSRGARPLAFRPLRPAPSVPTARHCAPEVPPKHIRSATGANAHANASVGYIARRLAPPTLGITIASEAQSGISVRRKCE